MPLHNDYEIRWKNFRCFADTQWITLKPLTILLGSNNSGKTSLMAPLLLMNQTMSSRDNSTPLVARGPLIDVGSFTEFSKDNSENSGVFFGLRYHTHNKKESTQHLGAYPPGSIEITLKEKESGIQLEKYEVQDIYKRPYLSIRKAQRAGYNFSLFGSTHEMTPDERRAIRRSTPVNFLFSPSSTLHAFMRSKSKDGLKESKGFTEGFSEYINVVGYAFEEVREFFSMLSYVGPLRARPKRFYEVSGEVPNSVGTSGENTANLLFHRRSAISETVNMWVKRFGFGDRLDISSASNGVFSLNFVSGKTKRNIADTGFGASQILPLIAQAAAAPSNSLTIAEQPEIHLNPHLQCVLADLFVQMVKDDHRIVVETHSEHLLLRLRRLIAQGKIDASNVALYFVERSNGESRIRLIPISKDGHISGESWPSGFLEEGLEEALALATEQAKKTL